MDRRRYLAVLAAGAVSTTRLQTSRQSSRGQALQSTTAATRRPIEAQTDSVTDGDSDTGPTSPERATVQLPVPKSKLQRGAPRDAIPAIVDPAFDSSWEETDREITSEAYTTPSLAPSDTVIGLVREDVSRAYPLKLLARHELVNDRLDIPLFVSYCPICHSGLVAYRRVNGTVRTFGVSGYLFRANLVLYDSQTESLWSQLLARAIRGPETGTNLTLTVSRMMRWDAWQSAHPETEVLLPPPASTTVVGDVAFNYDLDIYGRHQTVTDRYPEYGPLGELEWTDTRMKRRTMVLGIAHSGDAVAYPRRQIEWHEPIHDSVAGRPLVVVTGPGESLLAYDRQIESQTLTFTETADGLLYGGGSRWRPVDGVAIDGPHAGTRLTPVVTVGPVYWAGWLAAHPQTRVYSG